MRRLRRALVALLIAVGVVGAAGYAYLYVLQERFVFYPQPLAADATARAQAVAPVEDVALVTADGVRLHAWFVPAPRRAVAEAPALLWFHGNGGNVASTLSRIAAVREAVDASILALDYRGYGRSEGTPSGEGLLLDADAAYRYLTGARGIPAAHVVAYGHSLGGGVAAQAALRAPCAGLVLESTFTSIADVAAWQMWFVPFVRPLVRIELDSRAAVASLRVPLLVVHGTADTVIPFDFGRALYEASASPDKTFVPLEGVEHDEQGEAVRRFAPALAAFVARATE